MLTIRSEQLDVFATQAEQQFEQKLLVHARKCWPAEVKKAGEAVTSKSILQVTAQARGYGLTAEQHVALYLDLMYAFGPQFDTDPLHPWAGQILRDAEMTPQEKIDQLCERAEQEWNVRNEDQTTLT